MRRLLVLLLVLLPTALEAHEAVAPAFTCESLLSDEFGRTPDDRHNGLVSQQVKLSVPALVSAYRRGIFPWGSTLDGYGLWYRPPERGVLFLNEVRIGHSDMKYLRRVLASGELRVIKNHDFRQVVEQCATVPRYRSDSPTGNKIPDGAWITPEFIETYTALHSLGYAESWEVWRGDKMVGGLYGVTVDGVFTGESMFFLEPNATKAAMYALIKDQQARGHLFIDTQVVLGLAQKWGARSIPRAEYEQLLAQTRARAQAQAQTLNF